MIPLYEMSIEANPERWKGNSSSQGTPPPLRGVAKVRICVSFFGVMKISKN